MMFAVSRRVKDLLIGKYGAELEKCETMAEVVELLRVIARKEDLTIKEIKP